MSTECIHYWKIDTPNFYADTPAICTKCGASKTYEPPTEEELKRIENLGRRPGKYERKRHA